MGNLLTPLTKTPVVDWHDTVVGPDVPQSMMNALGSLERYTNVPVADAPTRETLMPSAQRYIGQTTYNVATDTFEYWDGTRWRPVNQKASFPSTINIASQVNVPLAANQYYDYRTTVNVTTPCIAHHLGQVRHPVLTHTDHLAGRLPAAGLRRQRVERHGRDGCLLPGQPRRCGDGYRDVRALHPHRRHPHDRSAGPVQRRLCRFVP